MKNTKENGITLVALVVTIVVLLILAGVSISLVVGNNGVLIQASNAVVETRKASAREDVEMALASAEADYWSDWAKGYGIEKNLTYYQGKIEGYLDKTGKYVSLDKNVEQEGTYELKYEKDGIEYTFIVYENGLVTVKGEGIAVNTGGTGTGSSTGNSIGGGNTGVGNQNTTDGNGSEETQEPEQATYTVRFNSNDGTETIVEQEFTIGKAQNLRENSFTREGYKFIGWDRDANATTATYENNKNVNNLSSKNGETINLYAIWKVKVAASEITSSATTYYGKTVNYSANDITDWKIFYADSNNIFIITSYYLPKLKVPAVSKMTTSGTCQAYWNSIPTAQTVTTALASNNSFSKFIYV